MARKPSKTLTDGELRIMEVLWNKGAASVRDVCDVLNENDDVAYNTVQTMMRILEDKNYLSHHKEGRAFVYTPMVDRKSARSSALKHFLGSFLIEDENIDKMEIDRLRKLLEDN